MGSWFSSHTSQGWDSKGKTNNCVPTSKAFFVTFLCQHNLVLTTLLKIIKLQRDTWGKDDKIQTGRCYH